MILPQYQKDGTNMTDFHLEKYEAAGVANAEDLKNIILKMADRIRQLEALLQD